MYLLLRLAKIDCHDNVVVWQTPLGVLLSRVAISFFTFFSFNLFQGESPFESLEEELEKEEEVQASKFMAYINQMG